MGCRVDSIPMKKEVLRYPVKPLAKIIAERVIHVLRGGASSQSLPRLRYSTTRSVTLFNTSVVSGDRNSSCLSLSLNVSFNHHLRAAASPARNDFPSPVEFLVLKPTRRDIVLAAIHNLSQLLYASKFWATRRET